MWGNTVAIHSVLKKKNYEAKNSQPAQYEKKIDKENSGKKIIKKKQKSMWGNTVAIHSVLKKKTTKLNSQPAQYEKNKIDKENSGKKIIKKTCGETL